VNILYLGYNSFRLHKRGVENVIDFQSKACDFDNIYYIHWGSKTTAYKNNRFVCISIKNCWYWPIILNSMIYQLKQRTKFLTHSHNPIFSFFSIFKTDILTVHDGLYYLNKSMGKKYSLVFKIIEWLLYFRCSMVHFISNYTKEQTLFGNRKNFVIIPNTSHLEPIVSLEKIQQSNHHKNSILIVRSIEERARFDLLTQVAERLKDKDYIFTVAGKGPLLEHIKTEIYEKKLRNIKMLGYVDDNELIYLYSNCDIVLMIAEYGEGFGLPIIEGYLFNKPVIATNKCAIPEVIISKKYLFENTVDSIIKTLIGVAENNNEIYREFYDLKYSNSIVLSRFRTLYSK